jgi:hypothetical protein
MPPAAENRPTGRLGRSNPASNDERGALDLAGGAAIVVVVVLILLALWVLVR